MTMGDESLFASLAMPVVLIPILEKVRLRMIVLVLVNIVLRKISQLLKVLYVIFQLEKRDYGAAQALKAALIKVC